MMTKTSGRTLIIILGNILTLAFSTPSTENIKLVKSVGNDLIPKTVNRGDVLNVMQSIDRAYYCGCEKNKSGAWVNCKCDQDCWYQNGPCSFHIGNQTISAPHMHLYALERIYKRLIEGPTTVLDVGGGSGYISAACHQIVESNGIEGTVIHYFDNSKNIVEFGRHNIAQERPQALNKDAKNRIELYFGNCYNGCKLPGHNEYRYDVIHVGAALNSTSLKALTRQLNPGGIMVVPIEHKNGEQEIRVFGKTRDGKGTFKELDKAMSVRYVPLTDKEISQEQG